MREFIRRCGTTLGMFHIYLFKYAHVTQHTTLNKQSQGDYNQDGLVSMPVSLGPGSRAHPTLTGRTSKYPFHQVDVKI